MRRIKNKKIIAIIPARGGSKGIPRKNIKLLGGKPLIAYTIEAASKSKYIDRTILSTDDEEIAEKGKQLGVEVPFIRPPEFARDDSSTLSVILHTLGWLEKEESYSPDLIVLLQPTSPFRKTKHIDGGLQKMKNCDGVIGVSEVKNHPYYTFKKEEGLLKSFIEIERLPLRRQALPQVFCLNGALYISTREYYSIAKDPDFVAPIVAGKIKGVFMDEISSIEIDTPLDFKLAELIIKNDLHKNKR